MKKITGISIHSSTGKNSFYKVPLKDIPKLMKQLRNFLNEYIEVQSAELMEEHIHKHGKFLERAVKKFRRDAK